MRAQFVASSEISCIFGCGKCCTFSFKIPTMGFLLVLNGEVEKTLLWFEENQSLTWLIFKPLFRLLKLIKTH